MNVPGELAVVRLARIEWDINDQLSVHCQTQCGVPALEGQDLSGTAQELRHVHNEDLRVNRHDTGTRHKHSKMALNQFLYIFDVSQIRALEQAVP
ncbi:hypothetical protein [Leisingera sp. F5]|uniref:hypothetical protein n=1 Tax=Leisingera sp. F5 TaxID=1813816 RepID=UPI000B326626|nr:hypothetical protein [Leisingera sp. F5]